jgi:lipid A ethanolaminephosphotransferase
LSAPSRFAALFRPRPLSTVALTALVSLWCLSALNAAFWGRVWTLRPPASFRDVVFLASLALLAAVVINLFLTVLTLVRPLAKPLLASVVVLGALASYFVLAYGVLIDKTMIRNVFETDAVESAELVNAKLLGYVALLGVLPALAVLRWPVQRLSWRTEALQRVGVLVASAAAVGLIAAGFYQDHASLLRNNRELRHVLVPVNWIAGVGSHVADSTRKPLPYEPIGDGARTGARLAPPAAAAGAAATAAGAADRPFVMVLVVGETVRAENFGLAGYARQTTPELAELPGLVYFTEVSPCGTSTAISVPCMFSDLGREGFSPQRARARDNLIDILGKAGWERRWHGNNTSCKGVCRDVTELRADPRAYPQLCKPGQPCMDGAMFEDFERGLGALAPRQVIVLHMLGSHGPGYHLRYPPEFGRFTPECRQTDFSKCAVAEIVNAYDNTVLYTDHLLAGAIGSLQRLSPQVDSALLYVSDHGESLGENGIFLHAMPYAVAPRLQTHVPMVFWASPGAVERLGVDMACVAARRDTPLSHDNLFHSVLGLLDVETRARDPGLDLFAPCRRPVQPSAARADPARAG